MPGRELVPEPQQLDLDLAEAYPLARIEPPTSRHPLSPASFTAADIVVGGSIGVFIGIFLIGLVMWMPLLVLFFGPATLATFSLGLLLDQRTCAAQSVLAGRDQYRELTDPRHMPQHRVEVSGDRKQTTLRLVRIDCRNATRAGDIRSVLEEMVFTDADPDNLEAAIEAKLRLNHECDRLNHESRSDHIANRRRDDEMKEFRHMLQDIE